jgi:hypothetical protein
MKMLLQRLPSTSKSTTGKLTIDGLAECYTLEDVCRPAGVKVAGKTAIPAGTYQVIIDMSTRFKVLMPLLIGVPGFAGIRIHAGNTDADTDGCILVGKTPATDAVYQSRDAYKALFAKIQAGLKVGKVWITIEGPAGMCAPVAVKTVAPVAVKKPAAPPAARA